MGSSFARSVVLATVVLTLLGATGTTVRGATHGAPTAGATAITESAAAQTDGSLNRSLRQFGTAVQGTAVGDVLVGQRLNVRVAGSDGSTRTRGLLLRSDGGVSLERIGYPDPDLTAQLPESAVGSIAESGAPGIALQKGIKYGLVSISGSGGAGDLLTGLGVAGVSQESQAELAVSHVDLDGDGTTDAILEIQAIDSDGSGTFDRLVRTVVRDTDADGELDTITSETRPVDGSVTGSVTLDLDEAEGRDTVLRLTGIDTDGDGRMDRQRKVTLLDTGGDDQFDEYAESVGPIAPTTAVTGEWSPIRDGRGRVQMEVEGIDADGDERFERKVLSVALDLDGESGFESTSETTSDVVPSLRISAQFDTDGDDQPDASARLSASDSNGDGSLETSESTVVRDSDGDGEYDTVVDRSVSSRGFLSNSGDSIQFLDEPRTLTIIGVVVSVLGIVLQLLQGG